MNLKHKTSIFIIFFSSYCWLFFAEALGAKVIFGILIALSIAYIIYGDKKIKCLKCSNKMWKDAHRCASCHWDYEKSYDESYEAWDSYFGRVCAFGLAANKLKTYIVIPLVSILVYFIFEFCIQYSFEHNFYEAWIKTINRPFPNFIYTMLNLILYVLFTGIFSSENERENYWQC